MRQSIRPYLCIGFFIFSLTIPAFGCDLCAIYSARRSIEAPIGSFQAGFTEQFTQFAGRTDDLADIDATNSGTQYMRSSISQFYLGYHAVESLSFQLTVPYLYKRYRRIQAGITEKGNEYGIGDLSLLAQFEPINVKEADRIMSIQLFTGVKLPTGDSDRIREEEDDSIQSRNFRHSSENGTLVGGDDLTIGTGSTDVLFGGSIYSSIKRYYFTAGLLYALRSEGTANFEFGDEISWNAGPGVHLFTGHEQTLSLLARLSGDAKQADTQSGRSISGSSHDRVYLGPEFSYSTGGNWNTSLGIDIPVKRGDVTEGVEPEYRVNFRGSYWF